MCACESENTLRRSPLARLSTSVERVVFLAAAVVVGRDGGVMVEGRSEVGRTVSRLGRRSRGARGGRCPGREARDRGQSHRVVKG